MILLNEELQIHWTNIAPLLTIRNEREYNAAVKRLSVMRGFDPDFPRNLSKTLMVD